MMRGVPFLNVFLAGMTKQFVLELVVLQNPMTCGFEADL